MVCSALDKIYSYIRQLYTGQVDSDIFKKCYLLSEAILTSIPPQSLIDYKSIGIYGKMAEDYLKLYKVVMSNKSSVTAKTGFMNVDFFLMSKITTIEKRHINVMERINDFNNLLASSRLRAAPYSISLFGGSSIGKTSACAHLLHYLNIVADLPTDPEFHYTFAPGHKYMDGLAPWKTACILDDVAAVRRDFMAEGDPMVIDILRMVNNAPFMTNQAEISAKNSTPFMAQILIATTNVKSLSAETYMVWAATVLRRMLRHVTLIPVGIYDDHGKLNVAAAQAWSSDPSNSGAFPPFWSWTIEEYAVTNSSNSISGQFRVINFIDSITGTTIPLRMFQPILHYLSFVKIF